MEGRVEHLPNIEIQVNYLEEEAREEFGKREAAQGLAVFPWVGSCTPSRGQQGSKAGMIGSRAQEGRDKTCEDQMPFLGALIAFTLSLILTLIVTRLALRLVSGALCWSVYTHKYEWGKEPGDGGGSW